MCHFITLIAPTEDAAAVDALMRSHGRQGTPYHNASIAAQLLDGEKLYLTTAKSCDCGTILAHYRSDEETEETIRASAQKLRRKKWSDAKIERWIEDRLKRANRPPDENHDSIEQWVSIVEALKTELGLPYVGLFLHFYSGDLYDEQIDASRRKADPKLSLHEQLENIVVDQLTIF